MRLLSLWCAGTIPEHLAQIPNLQRFTCWGNANLARRYSPNTLYQLGNIDSVATFETQVKIRELPDLKFF